MASVASSLASIVGGNLTDGVAKIISLFKVDPNVAAQHAADIAKINAEIQEKILDSAQAMSVAQAEVNKAEASNPRVFVAGWRPFIGWVCGVGIAVKFIIGPLFTWFALLIHHPAPFPEISIAELLALLTGMLGLGGLRTYEKKSGVDTTDFQG